MENQTKNAPYAVTALVLGICSLVFGCFFVGFVCGIVGIVLSNKGIEAYNKQPELYTGYSMLKAGKITSILGVIFGAIYIVYYIIAICILGTAGFAWLEWMNMFSWHDAGLRVIAMRVQAAIRNQLPVMRIPKSHASVVPWALGREYLPIPDMAIDGNLVGEFGSNVSNGERAFFLAQRADMGDSAV